MRKRPTAIDLFGAPGGMSEGFRQAGYEILAAIDSDAWGCQTLRYNHPETEVIHADLTEVKISEIEEGIENANVDVIVGGPPCQGFSIVGRSKIASLNENNPAFNDPRNNLYKTFIKIVERFRPRLFVMENVPGILSTAKGTVRDDIINGFNAIGYETTAEILNAVDYGVPQNRRRVFFIGNREGLEGDPFPVPERNRVTVWEAISDLPRLEPGEGGEISDYTQLPETDYQKRRRRWSKKLYNHVARCHNDRDLEIFRLIRRGVKYTELPNSLKPYRDDIFMDKYRVQVPDRPSSTIVAHICKDGLRYIHPEQNRSFTVREAARLQSFDDRYRFMGPRTRQFIQVGNAVPPLLAGAIASHIKKFLT